MELFARRGLYMYLVVLALLLPLPAAAQTVGKLYVTCPANRTVASSTGSAVAVTYGATTEGGVAPVTVSYYPASGSLFSVGTTTVHVNARSSDGQSSWCSFRVTVTSTTSTGGTLYVTCPANRTVASSTGSAVAVTYSATTEGGVAPVTVSYYPASGSLFSVGPTTVHVNARSSDGQSSWCSFTVTVTSTSTTSTGGHALRNLSGKQDGGLFDRLGGGGDLQCDHGGRRRTGDGLLQPDIGQPVPRRDDKRERERAVQ